MGVMDLLFGQINVFVYKKCTEKKLNSWQDLVVVQNFPVVGGDWYYRGLLAFRV